MYEMKAAQIVDAVDMVGMGVGEQDSIYVRDIFPDNLLSQIGRGVNKYEFAVVFNNDGGTGPLVPGITG